ncbi:MAG: bifunctional DNA-formamidopyrimidine glycosylase/DNA-(apurinic or apyrimidinic site) lyase [candidate division Zixibacteria bacterium]|nr:bifunctional DNA-formamidopyrimidine glycosylase/DNA-(apurinic or apyrimidinic site) lyase [candidate division Zixibacteria bacterium]
MPELPEVETIVRGLRPILENRTFAKVRSYAPPSMVVVSDTFKKHKKSKLETLLPGRTVESISRRGKNLLISLSGNLTLWVHLKMTGKFRIVEPSTPRHKHDLVLFDLVSNSSQSTQNHLRFNDYRRFGRLRVYPNDELWLQPGLRDLGPEPLEIKADDFAKLFRSRTRMIKPALMDQSFIVGIGNIYADEALHLSRIHPTRVTSSVSPRKLVELHGHIQNLLKKSIKMMGTTVISFSGIYGLSGSFQKMLKVYGHEGEPCEHCGTKIVREKLGARSAHYCPHCQRRP